MIKRKAIELVIKNWKAILIVLLLVVIALKNSRDYRLMQTAYETQIQSHEAQVDGLKEIHKREIQEKQLLMESFLESIAIIEKEYEEAQDEIDELRDKKNSEYRRKFRHDKHALIEDIETKFGIEYVP
tara:strand:- start:1254 stop:1637 length:384 start_codon:yes stop_codon:yes gene_type:complete